MASQDRDRNFVMVDGEEKQEIIIVRRVAGGEDGHHGGAWKIAFADFMTAMMALFLVLWLVNAANEKTKKSVASYFNPVKLIDRKQSNKGLSEDTGAGASTNKKVKSNSDEEIPDEKDDGSEDPVKDREFFEDPFAVMDGLAKEEQAKIEESETSLVQAYLETTPSEDAFHDPFAQAVSSPSTIDKNEKPEGDTVPSNVEPLLADDVKPHQKTEENREPKRKKQKHDPTVPESQEVVEQAHEDKNAEKALDAAAADKLGVMSTAENKKDRTKKLEEMAADILKEIKGKLAEKFGDNELISQSLTVRTTPEGILISITDQHDFSMFRVGSAVPNGAIILAMEEISSVLKIRHGMVRVYGHTDARPYSGKGYDNWRLSTARSHSARLMLIRGGLERLRVSQVVGFADRQLLIPASPQADANRRIEILLEVS